jgi:hypothetical protein
VAVEERNIGLVLSFPFTYIFLVYILCVCLCVCLSVCLSSVCEEVSGKLLRKQAMRRNYYI